MEHHTASDAGIALTILCLMAAFYSWMAPGGRSLLVVYIAQLFGAVSCDISIKEDGRSSAKLYTAIVSFALLAVGFMMFFGA